MKLKQMLNCLQSPDIEKKILVLLRLETFVVLIRFKHKVDKF